MTRELAAAAPSPEKVAPVPVLDAGEWLEAVVAAPLPIIEGLIAPRLKMALIGSAKSRKTWLALQAALCTAAGRDFLAWRVPKPRRVLVIQMEVPDWSFHFRLTQVAAAIGIRPEDLGGRLRILNCRGVSILLQYETEGRRKHAEFVLRRHRVIVDGSRYELIGLPDEVRREAARLAQPDLPAPPAPTAGVAQTQGTHAGKALESAPSGSAPAG